MITEQINQDSLRKIKRRIYTFLGIVAVFVLIIIGRLFIIQIIQGGKFLQKSESNRIDIIRIKAPRGVIYDRKLRPIVTNEQIFIVSVVPGRIRPEKLENVVMKICELLNVPSGEALDRIAEQVKEPMRPIILKENVSQEILSVIAERKAEFEGIDIQIEQKRKYLYGALGCHLIGYLGEISQKELDRFANKGYYMGDLIGKFGIEREYDEYLRGEHGQKQMEVNVKRHEIRTLKITDPKPGNNLILTLDLDVQQAAEDAMDTKTGAVVVIDPNTGGILAMASKPSFDPGIFADLINRSSAMALLSDTRLPLMNRSIQSTYPTGSVFKIVDVTAGINEGIIEKNTTYYPCHGSMRIGRIYKCWIAAKKRIHGRMAVVEAFANSCDVFFYQLGIRLDVDLMAKYASKYGLGKKTGVELPNEKKGFIPTRLWKRRSFKLYDNDWFAGDSANMAIGQGEIIATPIQMANMVATAINGGIRFRPYTVQRITTYDGRMVREFSPKVVENMGMTDKTKQTLKECLQAVVDSGTARWTCYIKGLKIGGKTGTAQNPHGLDHAWFVAVAPIDNPVLAVCAFVEHGEHGSSAAAPIAKKIIGKYFGIEAPERKISVEDLPND